MPFEAAARCRPDAEAPAGLPRSSAGLLVVLPTPADCSGVEVLLSCGSPVLYNKNLLCKRGSSYDVCMADEQVSARRSVAEVRKDFTEVINRAHYNAAHTVVVRYEEPRAVIVDAAWYERACRALGEESRLAAPPAADS